MISNKLEFKPMFSGHETFPLRHGWLKKVYDSMCCEENGSKSARDVFNSDDAIALFGVGKNMVASMRHWATRTGIIDEENQQLTDEAKMIFGEDGLDPWLESPISLWILHWRLARNKSLLTYYWFFNQANGAAFDREYIQKSLLSLCEKTGHKPPSPMTLKRDIDCFVRMYVSKSSKLGQISEDSLESPLAELNLINTINRRGVFQPRRGAKSTLTTGVFLLVLHDFWQLNWENQKTLSLEASVYDEGSPGRIFLLDEDAVLNMAYTISTLDLGLEWSETSGMRQFQINSSLDELGKTAIELIKKEYEG